MFLAKQLMKGRSKSMEWIKSSPVSSIVGIVIAVVLVLIALKMLRSIARPILITIVVVAGILIFFNVLDLAFLASTGQKLLQYIFDRSVDAGKEAIVNGISSFISVRF